MLKFGTALAVSAAFIQTSVPVGAQTPETPINAAPAKPLTTCETLARDWRSIEYTLADNYAAGVVDDSAPRATMRAAENTQSLIRAEITLDLMRDNKCSLPKRAPSEMTYSLHAMKCRTERLKGNLRSPECDYSNWKALGQ